ncbi:hypothetical protein SAMN05444064_111114 [Pseudomonas syringae]|uniref:hypothetical protein n=1 Tax=Pseudomonas syringae TaxID=317 RepID=UPI0008954674|nr:hypothetical protein [Pseudomonas syringae]SDX48436.1 hypothetical protein SAMN05444514_12336 [Pseudomonas syringae]SFM21811.1 hypothetical protein SAMN05444064_111114 [Pseudomonas syringae]
MTTQWTIALAVSAILAASCAANGAKPPVETNVVAIIKFVKRAGGPVIRFDPASCPACVPVADAYWNADNVRETVIALKVPRSRSLELAFSGAVENVTRVILESGDIPFRLEDDRLIVALAPLTADAITAAEVSTHIVEPGMVLRLEHADPLRYAGLYAQQPDPAVQRAAANVLEFAQREVVRELELGVHVQRRGLGNIQIMGFDTNAPHGHLDAPPHVHMHLRWPANTGTQIAHYYIGTDGLLTHNIVGVKGSDTPERRFERGASFTTVGPDGLAVYTHRITPEGFLQISRPDGAMCVIKPVRAEESGFASGASITCTTGTKRTINVHDDLHKGRLSVRIDDVVEVFSYDPDTGVLRSPMQPPPAPPSVYVEAMTGKDLPSALPD